MNLRVAKEALEEHGEVTFTAHGHSMEPRIKHGEKVTVRKIEGSVVEPGDVVLCKVRGDLFLHKVLSKSWQSVLIGNNRGFENGWTLFKNVYGKVVES